MYFLGVGVIEGGRCIAGGFMGVHVGDFVVAVLARLMVGKLGRLMGYEVVFFASVNCG